MPHDVFLSHSSKDKLAADAACAMLESEGIRCWIAPRDITPGAEWSASIMDAIGEVKIFVLLFSQHANESHQVQREVELAVSRGIPIVPVRLERVSPSRQLGFFISTQHWLDAFSPPLQRHLTYLARIVRGLLDGEPIEPALPQPVPRPAPPQPPRTIGLWRIAGGAGLAVILVLAAWRLLVATTPSPATNSPAPAASNTTVTGVAAPAPPAPDWAGCDEAPTVPGCSVIIRQGADAPQNMAIAYLRRGIAYKAAGDTQHAIADDNDAIRLSPGLAIAFANRGASYADLGNFSQAIHDDDSAIALKPDLERTLSNRCYARAAANAALDQALADCNQALRLDPDDVYARSNRGFAYFRFGQLDPALTDLNAALAIDAVQADPLYLRGLIKRARGDAAGAAADIAAATASDRNVSARFSRLGLGG